MICKTEEKLDVFFIKNLDVFVIIALKVQHLERKNNAYQYINVYFQHKASIINSKFKWRK